MVNVLGLPMDQPDNFLGRQVDYALSYSQC